MFITEFIGNKKNILSNNRFKEKINRETKKKFYVNSVHNIENNKPKKNLGCPTGTLQKPEDAVIDFCFSQNS